jgi:hypothetical protein
LKYIKHKSGAIMIDMKMKPSIEGWACSGVNVAGGYVPKIYIRKPLASEESAYEVIEKDTIKIYYSPKLKIKEGFPEIIIKLEKFLFFKWLDLEGV